uniref:Uncharacterized protein n=1 Tax=Panagrolaimus superbus TaxID=310955 RepID=A0A914YH12_9BILA
MLFHCINENEVVVKTADFLSENFLQSAQDIKEKPDVSIDQKCLECEVMILMELFILQSRPCPLSQTNIIKKFRFIYWNRGNGTREFLDGAICEQFSVDIPLYLTQIYEELDFDVPIELKKYESLENQIIEEPSEVLMNMNKDVKEKCKLLLDAVNPESIKLVSTKSLKSEKKKHELRRSPRKSRPPLSYSPMKTFPRPKMKNDTPNKGEDNYNGRKRRVFVAETPEEKLAKKKKEDDGDVENEIVAQTPFEKIKKTSKAKEKDSKRLTELLKHAEATKRRASKRLSFGPSNGCTQNSSTSQSCISPSQSSSVIKHSYSLATLSRVSSTKSLSTLSAFSAPSLRSPTKPPSSSNLSSDVTTPTSTVPDHLNAALTLSPDIIQKYKRRMDFVRLTSKKADSTEIFYGRLAGRPNLFNELNEAAAKMALEKPITRATATMASQKNRSGRKVEQDTNAVYIAHTLLNVHNETPLNPFKAPKDSPFKAKIAKDKSSVVPDIFYRPQLRLRCQLLL